MGAGGFNGRVRNGIGWNSPARTTSPAKDASSMFANMLAHASRCETRSRVLCRCTKTPSRCVDCLALFPGMERGVLSVSSVTIERLGPVSSMHCCDLHTWPIDVVVFHGSQAKPGFEVSFPLRCVQRLSRPHLATRLCRWHDNRSTRGTFLPVLSY